MPNWIIFVLLEKIRPCPISDSQFKNNRSFKIKRSRNNCQFRTILVIFPIRLENKIKIEDVAVIKTMEKTLQLNHTKRMVYGQKRHTTLTILRAKLI